MANRWAVTLEMDGPEPRIELDRIVLSVDGNSWARELADGIWVDPITRTAMLAPLPTTAGWETTYTGEYTRLDKGDYTLGTPGDWVEVPRRDPADIYLESPTNAKATTTATYDANQPFYISFYVPGVESLGEQTVFKCGWGVEGDPDSITLRVRANGTIAIYKAGDIAGVYSLEGGLLAPGTTKGSPKSVARQTVPLLLIPCRRRELLVVSSSGTGFSHVFTDLNAFLTDNTITPSGAFWWQAPVTRASCQLAPLRFEQSGVIYGQLTQMRYPLPTGSAFDLIPAYDSIGVGVLEGGEVDIVESDLTDYVPDGIVDQVRIKLTLTGDGGSTYGVYALDTISQITTTQTADAPLNLTGRIHALSLSVPENGPVTGTVSVFNPARLIAEGLEQADTIGDRPFRVAIGGVDILRGTTGRPKRDYSKGNRSGIADLLTWELFDREREFREKQFVSSVPYDGIYLVDAVEDLVGLAGFSASNTLVSSDPFILPYTPAVSLGEWKLAPERGDTIAQWLDKLHSTYCPTWIRGWVPTLAGYKYQFMDPNDLSDSPVISLYQSHADAIAGGIAAGLAPYRVIRELSTEKQTAEANQVVIIGQEPGTRRLITAQYDDAASQDPTTAPGSRPENWRGRTATVQVIDPGITSQEAADRAVAILAERLTMGRTLATWESDLLVHSGNDRPLWKGDVVRICAPGRTSYGDYRIIAIPQIPVVWESPNSTEFDIRRCRYIGVKIATGSKFPDVAEGA